jgi:aquaporin Z
MEAAEMAMLMLCICGAGTLLYGRYSAVANLGLSWLARSAIMGAIVAGATFIIIRSPFGRRSGAHFNPALTVAYFSLGRIHHWDAFSYVMAHFVGGIAGVFFAHRLLGANLSDFPVRYVVTLPGHNGSMIAFIAELITSSPPASVCQPQRHCTEKSQVLTASIARRSSMIFNRTAPSTVALLPFTIVLYQ